MKTRNRFLTIFLAIFLLMLAGAPSFAAAPTTYIGTDVDKATAAIYADMLGAKQYKTYTQNLADNTFLDSNLRLTDAITMQQGSGIQVNIKQNTDTGIDMLGYMDFVLSLGLYNSHSIVINNNTQSSLAMLLTAYKDQGGNIPSDRITLVRQELDLYQAMLKETGNLEKTSQVFFDIEKDAMEEPDLQVYTNAIVTMALTREGVNASQDLHTKLNTWTLNYVTKSADWPEFFRTINIPQITDSTIITVTFRPLDSAPTGAESVSFGQKAAALVIFIIFLAVVLYLVYRNKQGALFKQK